MNLLTESGAVYYFEIPLGDGDYAIGSLEGSGIGAGILYLDIGANGDMSVGEKPDGNHAHAMSGITFVDDAAIQARSTSGYSTIAFQLALNNEGVNTSGVLTTYNRESNALLTYSFIGSSFNIKSFKLKDDETEVKQKE